MIESTCAACKVPKALPSMAACNSDNTLFSGLAGHLDARLGHLPLCLQASDNVRLYGLGPAQPGTGCARIGGVPQRHNQEGPKLGMPFALVLLQH